MQIRSPRSPRGCSLFSPSRRHKPRYHEKRPRPPVFGILLPFSSYRDGRPTELLRAQIWEALTWFMILHGSTLDKYARLRSHTFPTNVVITIYLFVRPILFVFVFVFSFSLFLSFLYIFYFRFNCLYQARCGY